MLGSIQSQAVFTFRYDVERQQTWLSERKTGGLCHVSKPYWDGDVLLTQVINPTAGLFAGDTLAIRVSVEEGSSVALTSPSATRFHTMDSEKARVDQHFSIKEGAYLEFLPDWNIPQKNSEVEQDTTVDVAKGGQCVFVERFMPGRIAHGEAYTFRSFTARTKVYYASKLVSQERMHLEGGEDGWPLHTREFKISYYGAFWLVKENIKDQQKIVYELENLLSSDQIYCGVTLLNDSVMIVRLMASRSVHMQSCIVQTRKHLTSVFPELKGADRVIG